MKDQTVEDWLRGYLHSYLPDNDATEALVEQCVERIGWGRNAPLTEEQRESLKANFLGSEPASLVQIVRQVLNKHGVDCTEQQVRWAAREWLQKEAAPLLRKAVEVDTELPPIYTKEIRARATAGLKRLL